MSLAQYMGITLNVHRQKVLTIVMQRQKVPSANMGLSGDSLQCISHALEGTNFCVTSQDTTF
jgi:hypothetical protein